MRVSTHPAPRGEVVASHAPSHVAAASRPQATVAIENSRPLSVPDLVEKFGKSAYTIREWAKKRKLKGAKRVGRDWAFPLDVDYIDGTTVAIAPTVQLAVKEALELLNRYQIGAGRAA